MEEIGTTNSKYQHAIATLMAPIDSCAHAQKTIPLEPIYSFTRQIVPSLHQQSSI